MIIEDQDIIQAAQPKSISKSVLNENILTMIKAGENSKTSESDSAEITDNEEIDEDKQKLEQEQERQEKHKNQERQEKQKNQERQERLEWLRVQERSQFVQRNQRITLKKKEENEQQCLCQDAQSSFEELKRTNSNKIDAR